MRVDVAESHDGSVSLASEYGREHKVGESTEGEESVEQEGIASCQHPLEGQLQDLQLLTVPASSFEGNPEQTLPRWLQLKFE